MFARSVPCQVFYKSSMLIFEQYCKQEQVERENTQPETQCVNCQRTGHRARDCDQERINPHACKNCKQEGHNAKDCTEPRSAEGVECRKCNETGHFSKDVSSQFGIRGSKVQNR